MLDWKRVNELAFPGWINETFEIYRLSKDNPEKPSANGKFSPFKYQLFLRDYMDDQSPYRGVLLYHGLGTGKTCTAITIAENLRKTSDREVVVLLPASLIPNFVEEGLKFCADESYQEEDASLEPYIFVSYNATNTLKKIERVPGGLDDKVIIIEEVHNLVSMMANEDSSKGGKIRDMLMEAKNCKIVALSGTPIVNQPFEIAVLLNILRGFIEVVYMKIENIEGKKFQYMSVEEEIRAEVPDVDFISTNLQTRIVELHLKYRQDRKPEFDDVLEKVKNIYDRSGVSLDLSQVKDFTLLPDTQKEFDKLFIRNNELKNENILKRRMMGLISYYQPVLSDYPDVEIHEPVRVPMSDYQFSQYRIISSAEKKSVMGRKYRIYTRQISNFVFPEDIDRPGFSDVVELLEPAKNEKENKRMKALEKETEEDRIESKMAKKNEIVKAMKELDASKDVLTIDGLKKYSPKMLAILEKILESDGMCFFYSDFRTLEGVGIFALILKHHGFEEFDPSAPKTKKPTFVLYSGTEDRRYRTKAIKLARSKENKNGEFVKVFLATKAGAEGLDLKYVRQIHVLEPYWNEVRVEQVIGRGVRRGSHKDLPKDQQKVDVYRYLSVFTEDQAKQMKVKESTDEQIYEIALKKKTVTDAILQAIKEVAIDCVLNFEMNPPIDCLTFGDDTEGLAYLPQIQQDLAYKPTETTVVVKRDLVLGGIDKKKRLYIVDTKKRAVFDLEDIERSEPIKPRPKIKKKVWMDLQNRLVYDYKYAKLKLDQPPIGIIDKKGKMK